MQFGRSLFGGALFPRQVTAEGSVSATGRCIADEVASYKAGGGTFSTASVARGEGIRNVLPVLVAGAGVASVQVAEVAHFLLGGLAQIPASVEATARAYFNPGASPEGVASVSGRIIRTIRMPRVSYATGLASPEAEAYVYVYVRGEAARAYARPFGTYFYVGWGLNTSAASASATAVHTRMTGGAAPASSSAAGTATTAYNIAPLPVRAQALPDSDPELEIEGITHVFGRGEGRPQAQLVADAYVYTVMLAVGRLTLSGEAQITFAGVGRAAAASSATGSMERVLPFKGSVTVGADARGGARARLAAFGASRIVSVAATGQASARFDATAEARTDSSATAQILRLALETRPGAAGGSATGTNLWLLRQAYSAGAIAMLAGCSARGVAKYFSSGGASGLSQPAAEWALHPKIPIAGDGLAEANVVSLEERLAERAAGRALGEALPEGTNVVAGGDQALAKRVITVGPVPRTSVLPVTSRLVFVGGVSRLLAA